MSEPSAPKIVVLQEVWSQCSGNYDTVQRTRTLVVPPTATVAEIISWAKEINSLGAGDIRLTVEDRK